MIIIDENTINDLTQSDLKEFTASMNRYIDKLTNGSSGSYNPYIGEQFLSEISMSPQKLDNRRLANMLAHPHKNAKALRDFSQYLENTIMQYMRTLDYFSSILTYKYELIPMDNITELKKTGKMEDFIKAKSKSTKFLQKLNPVKTCHMVSDNVMRHGVAFYYKKETDNNVMLVELPRDYCTITGRHEFGWSFGINLAFFDRYIGLESSMPELYEQYRIFCIMREAKSPEAEKYIFYNIPPDIGWCFGFDENKPDQSPPFKQLFKDTCAISDYKDLLRTKVMLDTVMMLIQKIPINKETNRPMMTRGEAEDYVGMTQSNLPTGVVTTATPLECDLINFSSAQTQNNIIGLGESNFYNSAGISNVLFGGESKSALTLSYSTEVDCGFVDHLYFQYMDFINYNLMKVSPRIRFKVKMYGNRYKDDERIEKAKGVVQTLNFPLSCVTSYFYEPWEVENLLAMEKELKVKEKLVPIVSGSVMSGKDVDNKGGREKKADGDLKESGEITRNAESNAEK